MQCGGRFALKRLRFDCFQHWREYTDTFVRCHPLQSLLAALGSVQFVSNVVFAYLVLKETVTERFGLCFLIGYPNVRNSFSDKKLNA